MSESFHSQLWYRFAELKPALKPNLEISLHRYRGRPWFVIRNPLDGKVHRFTAEAYAIIGAMTGRAGLDAIWKASLDRLGRAAPTQDDVIQLMIQLYQSDLLLVDSVPLTEELVERSDKQRRKKRGRYWRNPMAVPLPLFDPDRILDALAPLVRGPMGMVWLILWLGLVGAALVVLPGEWRALSDISIREILALQNVAIMAMVYPVVKLIHEFAHGLALKRYGGEAHEIGVMFLVFYPVPYIDASASASIPNKYARALVGGAGILAEIGIAAAALFIWRAAEPGLLRDAAFNAMLIAGFSTVVVNGNPLLKFDGYYVLSDLIEIPNLGTRANGWWGAVLRRRLLNAPSPSTRPATAFEQWTFALYAPAAFVYRLVVMLGIALFVAGSYLTIGIALAVWSFLQGFVLPIGKVIKPFLTDARLIAKRRRAAVMVTAFVGGMAAFLTFVPVPLTATAEGVVWLPDEARLRSKTPGRLVELLADSDRRVEPGDPVMRLEEIGLDAEIAAQRARVREAQIVAQAESVRDQSAYRIAQEQLAEQRAGLAFLEERAEGLLVRAGSGGKLHIPGASDMPGRYFAEGELLGYILPAGTDTIRVAAPQPVAELLDGRLDGVSVRLADETARIYEAAVVRRIPSVRAALPSAALTPMGGGSIDVDPSQEDRLLALDPHIQIDLRMEDHIDRDRFGTRAHVKLHFGSEPLAYRIWRSVRRTFLKVFGSG